MNQDYEKEYESFENKDTNIDENDNNAFVCKEMNAVPTYTKLEPEYKMSEYKELELVQVYLTHISAARDNPS